MILMMLVLFTARAQQSSASSEARYSACVQFNHPNTKRSEIDLFTHTGGATLYCVNEGTQLHLVNIETNEAQHYSLKPIEEHSYGFLSLNFIDENTVVCIASNEKSLIIYNLKRQEVVKTISFSPLLKPLEYLYVSPVQRIEIVGTKLIIPTIFGSVSYTDQAVRQRVLKHAPFVIYDLKSEVISEPKHANPIKYQGQTYYDDYVPRFSSNGNNELYLSFKYSDSLGIYNLDTETLTKVHIPLPADMPQQGLQPDATPQEERKFRITEACIYNYIYNPTAKRHVILFKPTVPYIVNDRITKYEDIDWWLLSYDDSFTLQDKQFMNMDLVEWHILENKDAEIMLSVGIDRPNKQTITQKLTCLRLL